MTTYTNPAGPDQQIPNATTTSKASVGQLVAKVTAQFSALIRDEIKYATMQLKAKVVKSAVGAALFAVAGVLALYAFGILLLAAGYGIATVLPAWAAFLIVGGALLLICVILALLGVNRFKSAGKHELDPKSGIEQDIDAVKKGLDK
ncbi:MAG: phage holin family protein [Trueperella sp.]|nr:phage holin family protein [Trueperella sp.]